MINVEEAKKIISNSCKESKIVRSTILSAVGYVLAQDVIAKINIPSFNNSAMDGYALRDIDLKNGISTFNILDDVKAGDNSNITVKKGECAPIFTGAMIPNGADTVIMVEKTAIINGKMKVDKDYKSKTGKHIRLLGEQIKKGEIAVKENTYISPAVASYLSALGETTISIYKPPKIKIITTGNEIIKAGTNLELGQIYESNSTALLALLSEQKVKDITHNICRDTNEEMLNTLSDILEYDIVIITGGISVGKYDLVEEALRKVGVKKEFYKVAQKPGKPLFFGTKENTLIFALPGNPAAVITSYYQYIYPTIQKMMKREETELKKMHVPLLDNISIKPNRANFLKGKVKENGVEVLFGQGSHILSSFSEANSLIYLPKGKEEWKKGELVEAQILP